MPLIPLAADDLKDEMPSHGCTASPLQMRNPPNTCIGVDFRSLCFESILPRQCVTVCLSLFPITPISFHHPLRSRSPHTRHKER